MSRIAGTTAIAAGGMAISSSAVAITDAGFGFTAEQLEAANRAWITCSGNPVNYRYDGGDPDAGDAGGHQLPVGGATECLGTARINNLKFIAADSAGAIFITLEE